MDCGFSGISESSISNMKEYISGGINNTIEIMIDLIDDYGQCKFQLFRQLLSGVLTRKLWPNMYFHVFYQFSVQLHVYSRNDPPRLRQGGNSKVGFTTTHPSQ